MREAIALLQLSHMNYGLVETAPLNSREIGSFYNLYLKHSKAEVLNVIELYILFIQRQKYYKKKIYKNCSNYNLVRNFTNFGNFIGSQVMIYA